MLLISFCILITKEAVGVATGVFNKQERKCRRFLTTLEKEMTMVPKSRQRGELGRYEDPGQLGQNQPASTLEPLLGSAAVYRGRLSLAWLA